MENRDLKRGGRLARDEPARMCVICRNRFAKSRLRRYVLDNNGVMCLDGKKILQGRGWYCCANPPCIAKFANFRPKGKFAFHKEEKAADN